MVFWIGLLVAAAFAWFAVKTGFYETWTMLFNIVVAIYLAFFLRTIVADIIPAPGDMLYTNALTILAIAIVSFLVLHGISYVFLTSQFNVSFPKLFDILGSGFLGFLTGLLVWGFVIILISITPIAQNKFVKGIGLDNQLQQTNISYVSWWCNSLNKIVSTQNNEQATQHAIDWLLKDAEEKARPEKPKKAEPNEPDEPNDVETDITEH